ncbi:MAG: FHA domain-containing protein [Acidobacteriota bacterium]
MKRFLASLTAPERVTPCCKPRITEQMISCERCKTENLEGSQYCDECGAPLRPNFHPDASGTGSLRADHDGQNGSHAASKQPEFVPGSGSALSFAGSLGSNPKPHAWLVLERGRSRGKKFTLSALESFIGRWDADAGIFPDIDLDSDDPEAKVSRRHARITLQDGQYFLEDQGSTNGTFVNRGKRILPGQRQPLNDGDEIIVGKTFLRFHVAK